MPGMRLNARSVASATSEACHPAGKFSFQSAGLGWLWVLVMGT